MRDIMSGAPHIRDPAIHYLTHESHDLRAVCDFAGFDTGRVIQAAMKLARLGIREGVVYLTSLIAEADEVDDDDDYTGDN
jgi:hypothetical protein